MSLVTEIRRDLAEHREKGAKAWAEFSGYREENRDKLAKDAAVWERADELHKEYSVHAEAAAQLEGKLLTAIDWEGDGPPKDRREDVLNPAEQRKQIWTPGTRLTETDDYKALVESGELGRKSTAPGDFRFKTEQPISTRDEFKALITGLSDTSGGAFVVADRQPGLLDLLLRPIAVRNLVTVGDTDSDLVEWVRETTFTNAAAETAEATATAGASGTKPESALAYDVIQSTVRTIAHWIPATKRALADIGQLRTLIDQRLQDGVAQRLDSQMIVGDGTGENLRGILNTSGILTQNGTGMPAVEALLRAIVAVRLQFLEPNAILMHPTDFMEMRLATNASGEYIFGPPNIAGPAQAWGLPIITSTVVTQNTAIVGKWDEAILWVREGVTISASDSHSDFFIRNMVAVLAEGRFAFGVPRPYAFAQVTNV